MMKSRPLIWLIVPLLAVVAFAPVVGLWFVADDFGHLLYNSRLPFPTALMAFHGDNLFYRPLSTIFTWNIVSAIFGTNALPYHLISLALHALAAFLVARLAYTISNSVATGLIAGSIFAVYPLTTEPLAWLASQWDLLGTACVLGAALCFATAWKKGDWRPYMLGFFFALLAVGMKESTLPLPAVLPFIALAIRRPTLVSTKEAKPVAQSRSLITRLLETIRHRSSIIAAIAWAVPYALPTLLFAGVRVLGGGKIGGYTNAATDFQHFFWDALVAAFTTILMPLNRQVFDKTFTQVVGLVMSSILFGALIWWATKRKRMMFVSLAWVLVFLIPALNLVPLGSNPTNQTNRIYYLIMIGVSMALGSALSVPLEEWPLTARRAAGAAIALFIVLIIPVTWKQLEPWTQASQQTKYIVEELDAMLPPTNKNRLELNAHDMPTDYKGAYVFLNGLDSAIQVFHKQLVHLNSVDALSSEALVQPLTNIAGRWNLDFGFNDDNKLYEIDGLSGFTAGTDAPTAGLGGNVWDFSIYPQPPATPPKVKVDSPDLQWDNGLTPINASGSAELDISGLDMSLAGASWVRLAVAASYPAAKPDGLGEWFWSSGSNENEAHFKLHTSAEQYVYWTYIPTKEIGATLDTLRFKLTNAGAGLRITWISATPITPTAK